MTPSRSVATTAAHIGYSRHELARARGGKILVRFTCSHLCSAHGLAVPLFSWRLAMLRRKSSVVIAAVFLFAGACFAGAAWAGERQICELNETCQSVCTACCDWCHLGAPPYGKCCRKCEDGHLPVGGCTDDDEHPFCNSYNVTDGCGPLLLGYCWDDPGTTGTALTCNFSQGTTNNSCGDRAYCN